MSLLDHEETQPVIPMKFMVDRHVYYQDEFHHNFYCEKPETSFIDNTLSSIKSKNLKSCLSSIVPVSYWMRKYKWRDYVLSDIISGITVAIMHIPQGMAYALLGNVPPIVGIYMAFFPVLIYFIFGTSKHVSMGTFAIVCLMTGKVVASYSTSVNSSITNNTLVDFSEIINNHTIPTVYSPMQVATAVTFSVGIIQLVMFILRLGIISSLLSKSLVSGFTTGAAIYVLIYQIKDLLGLKLPKRKISHFKLVYTIIDIFNALNYSNYASLIISAVTISIMMINNELFKPWLEQKCSMLFPIELIAIVSGTIISKYFDLPGQYMIDTVGNIPTGLPKPELPTIELIGNVMVDCIAITMVSYTVTLSMALIFAQKLHYDIDSNQELFAMGLSNIFGSMFSCMPVSASLSRSLIQQTVGGKTQIASIISCSILLIILLYIGPFFEPLPRSVLASIIVVSLKGMLLQAKQFLEFWRLSRLDGMVWMVTVVTVIIIGIDFGLLIGLITSIGTILLLSMKSYACLLGQIPNTELYLDISKYRGITELPGIKIFHYRGGLNFANRNYFKSKIFKHVNINPQKEFESRKKEARKKSPYQNDLNLENNENLRCIVIDFSALTYIDPSGIAILHAVYDEFSSIGILVCLAGCSGPIFESISKYDQYVSAKTKLIIFMTINDAITYACNKFISNV
ncbi:prestin-like isoform X2 [Microplitis mediator]|uniref:prestin-like isoform X2 n=1 Tax=Microplitis mediator TaxID=375433 RepID=UPI0025538704|nr:prestin-like isoform X2 [Microplitis mediator]